MTFPIPGRWLALAGIVLVAVGVRCWRLDAPVLSHDEAFSWRLTQYAPGELCVRTGLDVHPPLYYLLLQAWCAGFGDGVWALRGLSVVLGVAAVLMAYGLILEVGNWVTWGAGSEHADAKPSAWHPDGAAGQSGALLVALLVALSPGQVEAGRNARMYAVGVVLAGVSAWLLLRALRAQVSRWSWWAAYGVVAAAFCYTHNYAFFTLFGQGVFVAGVMAVGKVRRATQEHGRSGDLPHVGRAQILFGFGYAALLAVILYYPWMRVLAEQMRQVKENYWMEQVTVPILEETLFTWGTGLPYDGAMTARIWLGLTALATAFAVWRLPGPAAFVLLQAWCPVALAAGLSLASGRSIFHDHLLVFGQFYLLCFWGVVWMALPGWLERACLGVALAGAGLAGLAAQIEQLPTSPPAVAEAAAYLAAHAEPGDEVWTGSAWELNQLRYYLAQADAGELKVRCRHAFPGKGHMVHIASISAEEVIWVGSEAKRALPDRVWVTNQSGPPGLGFESAMVKEFGGETRGAFQLRVFQTRQ